VAFSFEVSLQFVVVRATLLRADPAHPGGIAAVAASEKQVLLSPSRRLRPLGLELALSDINMQFGGVKNIVHTAAVVNDASTSVAGFENVLRPKVIGSWNLHIASQDLNLALESFVLFSSTK
jgi:KR domain